MTHSNTISPAPHWRKNPIVWLIIFFPSLAVVAGFYTLYLAIESDDGLVADDYYKQGIGINKTLTRDKNAINKNISGLISINARNGEVQAKFSDQVKSPLNPQLSFKLVHRTIPGYDQEIVLNKVGDTLLYSGSINSLPQSGGRWRWEIVGNDWRINQNFLSKDQETLVLSFPKQ